LIDRGRRDLEDEPTGSPISNLIGRQGGKIFEVRPRCDPPGEDKWQGDELALAWLASGLIEFDLAGLEDFSHVIENLFARHVHRIGIVERRFRLGPIDLYLRL
jgi:hypothetical protein